MRRPRDGLVSSRSMDYLKAAFILGALPGRDKWARFGEMARLLGVSVSTISVMTRRLEAKGLLEVREGYGVRLTEKGFRLLAEYLWKIGIVEVMLQKAGLGSEECRRFAERLVEGLDREATEALYKALGEPRVCPHNRPILRPEEITPENAHQLALCCGLAGIQEALKKQSR